jgi:hypothetical protein
LAAELHSGERLIERALHEVERGEGNASIELLRAERERLRDVVEQMISTDQVRPERAAEFRAVADAFEAQAAPLNEIEQARPAAERAERVAALRRRLQGASGTLDLPQPTFRSFSMQPPPAPPQAGPAPAAQ